MTSPGRGHWDRGASGDQRRRQREQRLLAAAAEVAAEKGVETTTTDIVRRAGVGRNTFYEHFENVDSAVVAACRGAVHETRAALVSAQATARTPVERLRALAAAWTQQVAAHPLAFRALLGPGATPAAGLVELRGALTALLSSIVTGARASGTVGQAADPFRVACVVGAYEAAAAELAGARIADPRRASESLVDLTLRAFR